MIELSCGLVQISGKCELPKGKWKFYYCVRCKKIYWIEIECCKVVCISGECK